MLAITYPRLSLILERQDTTNFLVELSWAMTPLGVLASALLRDDRLSDGKTNGDPNVVRCERG